LDEEEVTKSNFMDRVAQLMEIMSPFVSEEIFVAESSTD